jgi:hypothetical protein
MEERNPEVRLEQSRARLRSLLIPDPATGRIEADVFPRSIAMRVAVSGLPLLAKAVAGRSSWLQSLIRAFF